MSKNEFVKNVLSALLRECFGEILGASYQKEGKDEVIYINYKDANILKLNITGKSKREIVSEAFQAIEFGTEEI